MDEYKQHVRRLAVHDEAFLEAIAVDGNSFQHAVALALDYDVDAALERRDP